MRDTIQNISKALFLLTVLVPHNVRVLKLLILLHSETLGSFHLKYNLLSFILILGQACAKISKLKMKQLN